MNTEAVMEVHSNHCCLLPTIAGLASERTAVAIS